MNPINSMEVLNPPIETFESVNSYYSTQGSSPGLEMLQRIQELVDENNKLKSTIKKNSSEFSTKVASLQQWKNKWTAQAKNAKLVISRLKENILALQTANTKYELQLKEKSINNNCVGNDANESISDNTRKKYLNTLQSLEKELKETKECKENLEASESDLKNKVGQLENERSHLTQSIEEERRRFLILRQNVNDLLSKKETAEAKVKDMTNQLISLFNEQKLFQNEIAMLKNNRDELSHRCNLLENEGHKSQEMYNHLHQDHLLLLNKQEKNDSDVVDLRGKLIEKNKAIEEMYHEISKCQQPKQDGNVDNLLARLISAEESMKKRDREYKEQDSMKKELELKLKKSEENVQFFREQADVYKQDFLIERDDRTQQNATVNQLKSLLLEKDHTIEQFRRQVEQLNYDAVLRNPQANNR